MNNVFELIPPDVSHRRPPTVLSDAQINIQAFIANVYGAIDNLAWIWVHEAGLIDRIDKRKVGLRSHNVEVRQSLSVPMQAYLVGLDPWFTYVVEYRDALAHRIPLYIPERVRPDDVDVYNSLSVEMTEALNNLDANSYERLHAKQEQLLQFQPLITHSVTETTAQFYFHLQMTSDFLAVEELGKKMFEEIQAIR